MITARDSAVNVKSTDIYADLLFAAKKLSLFDDASSKKTTESRQSVKTEKNDG